MTYIVAIDQGTTSTRTLILDAHMHIIASAQKEFTQHFPHSGWVEHDADEIFDTVLETMAQALDKAKIDAGDVAAIGITNQRETTVMWDRTTGKPVAPAIVWQDRRTEPFCQTLRDEGFGTELTAKTGLLADPYFSGTKVVWLLDNVEGLRARAERGEIAFGTVDSFLIWRLTGGAVHATDATNASRTMLFNIHTQEWDADILKRFNVPRAILPSVKDCADDFGVTDASVAGGAVPIRGVAGDQQAATIGQACFAPGMMKSTYGTGCFALLNTGDKAVQSSNRLLTTVAYRLNGRATYALEGSIFMAGAAVQWLRDGLKIIGEAKEAGEMAAASNMDDEIVLVPAFVGLGAPYWDAEARGAMFGLTRGTGEKELARATLEAVCYQTRDLLEAMQKDIKADSDTVLRVDGGMVASDWTMQFLADILGAPVHRPVVTETTAFGAAWLAGSNIGLYPDQEEFAKTWQLEKAFEPAMGDERCAEKYARWQDAVRRTMSAN